VNTVIVTIKLHQFRFKICTDAVKKCTQVVKNLFCENFTAIFCHEDHMGMKQKNAVSSVADIVVMTPRPK
jgi:hypothetical protein